MRRIQALSDIQVALLLSFVAFVALILVFPFTMVGGDEGRFVQDALRIGRGEVPIADYTTRAPILSWFINFVATLFGRSIFIFRIPTLVFSALCTGMLYILGREFFTRNIVVIGALLHALVPYTLWNSHFIKTESLTILMAMLALDAAIRGTRGSRWWFVLSGAALGVGYIERQSILAMAMTIGLFLLITFWRKRYSIRHSIETVGVLGAGFLAGFLPVFIYTAVHHWDRAVTYWLDLFIVFSTQAAKAEISGATFSWYSFIRDWLLTFIEGVAIQGGLLFVGLIGFLIVSARLFFRNKKYIRDIVVYGVLAVLVGSFVIHTLTIVASGGFRHLVFLSLLVVALVAFGLLWRVIRASQTEERDRFGIEVILLWMIGLFVAYSFFAPGYPREFIPAIALGAGYVLSLIDWRRESRTIKTLYILVGIGFWLVSFAWFYDPKVGGWWWTQDTINSTASFISQHTAPEEKVFAANSLPVMIANRRTVADLTSYAIHFASNADDHRGTFPSPNELFSMLEANPPRYVIVDGRMERHIYAHYPMFQVFVEKHYIPVAFFGQAGKRERTEIWEYRKLTGGDL